MLWPPPSSPLFPYTTLFRSSFGSGLGYGSGYGLGYSPGFGGGIGGLGGLGGIGGLSSMGYSPGFGGGLGDRKSTRLNSSHLVISYAVFCLKKKNEYCCTCGI